MKWCVTGASGFLGEKICRRISELDAGELHGIGYTNITQSPSCKMHYVDILDFEGLSRIIDQIKPDIIIHCAAIANVDLCEVEKELSTRVNVTGVRNLSQLSKKNDAKFVYISTDQLWSDNKKWHSELDLPEPCNHYGVTKRNAEWIVNQIENSLVIRTNFFGIKSPKGNALLEAILGCLNNHKTFIGFSDVYFSPIEIELLVNLILDCINLSLTGVYHISGLERVSKYQFAIKAAEYFGCETSLIKMGTIKDLNFRAKRPLEMSLSTEKIRVKSGLNMPTLHESFQNIHQTSR